MAFACRYVEDAGGLDDTDVEALNRRLRRTLHNRNGHYHEPLDLVAQRLEPSQQLRFAAPRLQRAREGRQNP